MNIKQPESGEVFEMTNGEKVRIEFDRIFSYKSTQKTKVTEVDLGYSPDLETVFLDISFDDFDEKYQAYRKGMRDYYTALDNHRIY